MRLREKNVIIFLKWNMKNLHGFPEIFPISRSKQRDTIKIQLSEKSQNDLKDRGIIFLSQFCDPPGHSFIAFRQLSLVCLI